MLLLVVAERCDGDLDGAELLLELGLDWLIEKLVRVFCCELVKSGVACSPRVLVTKSPKTDARNRRQACLRPLLVASYQHSTCSTVFLHSQAIAIVFLFPKVIMHDPETW